MYLLTHALLQFLPFEYGLDLVLTDHSQTTLSTHLISPTLLHNLYRSCSFLPFLCDALSLARADTLPWILGYAKKPGGFSSVVHTTKDSDTSLLKFINS